jgi:N-acetylmuramoyl-L-alanine amidase
MKVLVNAGHTLSGKGTGAVGYINESEHTRLVANELIKQLKEAGVNAYGCSVDKSTNYLKEVVDKANASKCDLLISIHFNAGKGKGSEVYTWKGEQNNNVCTELQKLGFKNRGIKDGSHLYIIRKTTMKAILVEVCFLDTKTDVDLYKKVGVKKIAEAIKKGVVYEGHKKN